MSAAMKILAFALQNEFGDACYDIKDQSKHKWVHAWACDDCVMVQGPQLIHFCASDVHNREKKHHLL